MSFLKKLFGSQDDPNDQCTMEEKKLLMQIQKFFEQFTGYKEEDAEKVEKEARELLNQCIKKAIEEGLSNVTNLGDKLIKDENFFKKRLEAGLSKKDILNYWNRNYLEILIATELSNTVKFAIYMRFHEEGKSPLECAKQLRKMFVYFGDPQQSHQNFQGEDADIYPEFTKRYDKWRKKYQEQEIEKIVTNYTTYNAMLRERIRKGEL